MQPMCLEKFCGQGVNGAQIGEIAEIIKTFQRLSRTELANTICELFSWKRPNGRLKSVECRLFLEELDKKGIINSRFLILPWVEVKNLASMALCLAVKQIYVYPLASRFRRELAGLE
jgi:hypothetical protein